MSGKASYLALVDTNHVYKTTQYQIVGGSSLRTIGDWVLDSILLREADIIQYLLRPVESASDMLISKLFSMATTDKLVSYCTQNINDVSYHHITVIVMTLY